MVSVNEVCFAIFFLSLQQVLEAQRRHQKEKSGIIPTSPTPYTYNKVSCGTAYMSRSLKHIVLAFFSSTGVSAVNVVYRHSVSPETINFVIKFHSYDQEQ